VKADGERAWKSDDETGLHLLDASDSSHPLPAWSSISCSRAIRHIAVAGGINGDRLHVINVSDPRASVTSGTLDMPGTGWGSMAIHGSYLYVTPGPQIVDVSNPEHPVPAGSAATPIPASTGASGSVRP
jgi:hypothetical protein